MEKEILKTIRYFSFFNYLPSFEEIYIFLEKKVTKNKVEAILKSLESKNKIKKEKDLNNIRRYTLHVTHNDTVGEYGIKFKIKNSNLKIKKYNERYFFSQKKLQNWRFRLYVKLLSFFPQIKLIGLSGSLAMMNANKDDDIDLFIITAKNRLFTGRFVAAVLAKILGIHRSYNKRYTLHATRYTNKVCLNLFFDESDLAVPAFKRNEYVAHEVLQMRPIVNKDQIYERFLQSNDWVFEIFPNSKSNIKYQILKLHIKNQNHLNNFKFLTAILRFAFFILNFLEVKVEEALKSFQMYFINKHKTTEIITKTQLWFHPEDFYNKIKKITEKKVKRVTC